ncbi:MAG: alpha/beta fold hydrolase [Planctomycetota bacterium]|jgi:predicted esterase
MRRIWIVLLALAVPAAAGKVKPKEPGPKAKGKVYEWQASHGGRYWYFVPKSYDPQEGANLTFILHGSNGSKGWGIRSCPVGTTFRPDDIIVSPDGSQPGGANRYNRGADERELEYLHTLHTELRKIFTVRQTFIYGHSQGSYFAHHYAAAYPDAVDGYVAMASGVWTHTQIGEHNHHQAIVVMHGTQDPVVPYAYGVGAYEALRGAKYPKLHFRSLEGWNHWPTDNNSKVPHTAQQLAWCEGMTTKDMDRLAVSFDFLTAVKAKERHDYAGVYLLASHIVSLEGAPAGLKKRAQRAMRSVEAGARLHIAALDIPEPVQFEKKPWVGHLPMFLRAYRGVPAREEFAVKWEPLLAAHREAAVPHLRLSHQSTDPAEAFREGVAAIEVGFLHYECADFESFRRPLARWRKDRKLQLDRDAVKAYDALVPAYEKALKEAYRSFDAVNRKVGKL